MPRSGGLVSAELPSSAGHGRIVAVDVLRPTDPSGKYVRYEITKSVRFLVQVDDGEPIELAHARLVIEPLARAPEGA